MKYYERSAACLDVFVFLSSICLSEFDELEMCGSLSVTGNQRCGWHSDSDVAQTDDLTSLKCLVQDLRAQLSRCHKVIRGQQLRMRSLSTTSDYASSLERTPRKVTPSIINCTDSTQGNAIYNSLYRRLTR